MVKILTEPNGPRLYTAGIRGVTYEVPSVSEVLRLVNRSYLDAWRHRVGRKEADRVTGNATAIGSRVHAALKDIADGKKIVVARDIEPLVEAAERFLTLHVDEVLASELSVASLSQGFGGTLDLYCRMQDGSLALVDWKTSRQLSRTVGHQLAGYGLLMREKGYVVNRRIGVRLKKDKPGEFSAREYGDHRGDVAVFESCCSLWWAVNQQKKDRLLRWTPDGESVA